MWQIIVALVTIFREPDLNTHNSIQTLIFRCMIGWQDEAKTLFLGTVLGSGIISLILSDFVQHPYFSFEKEDFCTRIVLLVSRPIFLNPNLCPDMVLVPIDIFQVTAPWITRFLSCFSNCQFLDGSLYFCWYWTWVKKIQTCNQEYFKTSLEKLAYLLPTP